MPQEVNLSFLGMVPLRDPEGLNSGTPADDGGNRGRDEGARRSRADWALRPCTLPTPLQFFLKHNNPPNLLDDALTRKRVPQKKELPWTPATHTMGNCSSNFSSSNMRSTAMAAAKGLMNLEKVGKVGKVDNVGRRADLANLIKMLVPFG